MSDGMKDWHEKTEEYLALCKKYGEEPQTVTNCRGNQQPDVGCEHMMSLRKRDEAERKSS